MLVTRGLGRNLNDKNEFSGIPIVTAGLGLISVAKKKVVDYNYIGGIDARIEQINKARFKSRRQKIEEDDLFIIINLFLKIKESK